MSDLPDPVAQSMPMPAGQPAETAPYMPAQASQQAAMPASDKDLQSQTIEQIEAAVEQTAADPFRRADMVHGIKEAYIRARYHIDLKGGA